MLKFIKSELIDRAYNIPNFNNQTKELEYVLKRPINAHINVVYYGFQLTLELIEQYPELIRSTLYGTMVTVKNKYRQLTKFQCNYQQMNAVSLATNYVWELYDTLIKVKQAKAHTQQLLQQHEENNKITEQLANDIKDMLIPQGIWALKVEGEDIEGSKPFMIANTIKEVATVLGVSIYFVNKAMNQPNRTTKGYRLYTK